MNLDLKETTMIIEKVFLEDLRENGHLHEFSSVYGLHPLLAQGAEVILCRRVPDGASDGAVGTIQALKRINPGETSSQPSYRISIKAEEPYSRTISPWKTTLLEEQQATFIHELLHALRWAHIGLRRFKNPLREAMIEDAFNQLAYDMVRGNQKLIASVVVEMTARSNCRFYYQVPCTPFEKYHRELLLRHHGQRI